MVHDGDIVIVHPVGEIDLASAGQLRAVLNEAIASGRDLLVDLGDCPFMDSTGLGELLRARRRCADRDASFAVSCPAAGPPARVLQLAVGGHLAVHRTREAGVRALRACATGPPAR